MLVNSPIPRRLCHLCSLLVGGLLLCCFSCRNNVRLYSYQPVDPHGWSCTDTLRFEVSADSVATLRTFSLGIRFTELMDYRELWLVLEQRSSERLPRRDTLYLPLAHENGKWEATGVICHQTEVICTAALTPSLQPLELLVYHIMPEQNIHGITEVGVKVE